MKVKSLFISDLHLGSRLSNTKDILYLLKNIECENLFLVGDIIDFWALKTKFYFPMEHWQVIGKIIKFAKTGTKIYYIHGNHDDLLHDLHQDLHLPNEIEFHEFFKYKGILIFHGQQLDVWTRKYNFLCWLGDIGYFLAFYLNKITSKFCKKSLSSFLKRKTKSIFLPHFYTGAAKLALKFECHSVINGHTHQPKINGFVSGYKGVVNVYNCGDFIDNSSFLFEDFDGQIKMGFVEDLRKLRNNKKLC